MAHETVSNISSTRPSFNNVNVGTNYFNTIQARGYQHRSLPDDFGVNELHTMCDLALDNFSKGEAVGCNYFTGDNYGGALNWLPQTCFKERMLQEKTGEGSVSTWALIA